MGIQTSAHLTRMDNPVGKLIGNSLEVIEAVECLQGGGPSDLKQLVCQLGMPCGRSVGFLYVHITLVTSRRKVVLETKKDKLIPTMPKVALGRISP